MTPPSLRCVQILASIDDAASGPSYSVTRLSTELANNGVATALFAVSGWRQSTNAALNREPSGKHIACKQDYARVPGLRRLCLSRSLMNGLYKCAPETDIFHTHGLWLMPNVYPAWAARKSGCRVVISPRGMLGPEALRFSRFKKMAFWHFLQRAAVNEADCLHATSEREYEEFRAFGLRNPVAIIPNGIDLPVLASGENSRTSERTVLSLGRIHPKKGLDDLIWAWAKLEHDFPAWRLNIVGPDELGYTHKLKELANRLKLSRVMFAPPCYGSAKFAELQDADLFVLPTLNENFGIVVAEALASGTPVISTKGAPWGGLDTRGCGWWIDPGADPLAAALGQAMTMPRQALKDMGSKGRAWMAEAFSWQRVVTEMLEVYRWLMVRDAMPSTVRLQ